LALAAAVTNIERFSHLFLSVENQDDQPKILKLPFDQQRELLRFLGLKENPFIDAVNPTSYFRTAQHEVAYHKMRHCVEDAVPLGLLTAPSGMGKTLILQLLKHNLNEDHHIVVDFQVSQGLTKPAFLKSILYHLGLSKIFQGQNVFAHDLMILLQEKLQKAWSQEGKRLVLLLDEAQFLSLELWYTIKMISNIETPEKKLSTTLLFGESSLNKRLKQKNYDSLTNRMFVKEELHPLSVFEMKAYIHHKLAQVDFSGTLFEPEIYDVIFVATEGIFREINNLLYNALIEAFYMKKKLIDHEVLLKCLN
jgi:type II secretory pathway predicted ATPase ExeA